MYIDVDTGVYWGRAAYVWQYIAVTWFFCTYSHLCPMYYILEHAVTSLNVDEI